MGRESRGANKIGVWGLRPQRGPGAAPLAFLPYLARFAMHWRTILARHDAALSPYPLHI
jgi:hypothetical protein